MNESARYDAAYETGEYEPFNGLAHIRCLYRTHYFIGYKKLLDVGCGMGAAVRYHREIGGIEAKGIDFAKAVMPSWDKFGVKEWCMVASAEEIPFKNSEFDMVTCMDVLEHVPKDNVSKVLDEMIRVGNKDFLFIISLIPSVFKMPHDGSEPHICLEPPEWWLKKMVESGYRFYNLPCINRCSLWVNARKNEDKSRHHKSLQ